MPATCNYCGLTEVVYACPECKKKLRAEAKPKARSPIRHCKDCGAWRGGKFVIAKPKPYCRECLEARGLRMEDDEQAIELLHGITTIVRRSQ